MNGLLAIMRCLALAGIFSFVPQALHAQLVDPCPDFEIAETAKGDVEKEACFRAVGQAVLFCQNKATSKCSAAIEGTVESEWFASDKECIGRALCILTPLQAGKVKQKNSMTRAE